MARRQTTDRDGIDEPIGYFLEVLQFHGKSERLREKRGATRLEYERRSREHYERVRREFEPFVRPRAQPRRQATLAHSEADRDEVVNGEERSAANEHECATVIPVGDELTAVLSWWLAVPTGPIMEVEPYLSAPVGSGIGDSHPRWFPMSWKPTPERPSGTAGVAVPRRT